MQDKIQILLFYKFIEIKKPEKFIKEHLKFCKDLNVKGKVLVSTEGINGSISGTQSQIEEYKKQLTSYKEFSDIVFKQESGLEHPFKKMNVRLRKEIVAFGKIVNTKQGGQYITAEQLKQLYENKEEFLILDARNDYEYKVGKFKDAIQLNIKTFKQFPEALAKIENFKDKKIITYCTGGIRCEKASAYMKQKGFKNVYQLKDGIITFGQKFPATFWQGKCFVFDKRLVSDINNTNETISNCHTCNTPSDLYRNCRNTECDKLYIQCKDCQENFNGCCSKQCFEKFKEQCIQKSFRNQHKLKPSPVQTS